MKLLIIAPKWPEGSLWGQIYFRFPYLALTTLAALTGEDWKVSIIDENVDTIDFSDLPDLVAITIMTPLAKRGYEIADSFRRKGVSVVLGGIHPTMMNDEAKIHADSVIIGEAETTWPLVLLDFRRGKLKPFYEPANFCSLNKLAIPKRNLLKRKAYFFTNTIQTTRGCPFNCEFCSVTSFYGRTYRVRPVEDVINEIGCVEKGFMFFVDDNIVGKPLYAKELFRALIPLKIKWFSQASLTIVKDRELLKLAQKSGCRGLFIGFESLSQENLRAMGKSANTASKYKDAIKMLHNHGIGIQGSFIFGTDYDDSSVFSDVLRFIEKTHIEAILFSILTPFPGTRIYETMLRENRIIDTNWEKYDMNHVVFRPKKMTPKELQKGFNWAYRRLYEHRSILKRLFPFNRNSLFYGVQNYGFRQAWKKTLRNMP
ncbi:MAG: B12-binding domain-containing radical SAM protein [Deltaproteobacteria bacterium]|nr:B12-binding domain-containing radical SAM protein [Deltaproteobacteria bacterium]MBW2660733.1 B12-binding domain-containing radical SAM protein [Deltaproteobacteria bacterium]